MGKIELFAKNGLKILVFSSFSPKNIILRVFTFAKAISHNIFFMQGHSKKEIICKTLGNVARRLRGVQSQFMFSSENDISVSIVNTIERGIKDSQITTVFKLAEVFNMKPSDFIKLVENELPEGFNLIDR